MRVLVADSTGQWVWTQPSGVNPTDLSLVVTDPTGATVDLGTPSASNGVWTLSVQSADVPAPKVGRWVFDPQFTATINGNPQKRSDPQPVWLLPNSYDGYGDFDRVSGYLGRLASMMATSSPSLSEVLDQMDDDSVELDMRLAARGYVVPILETSAARRFIDHIVSLFAVAFVYERLAAARQPNIMGQAENYRKRAEAMLDRVLTGEIQLADVERTEAATGRTPTVISTMPAAIDADRTQTFIDRFSTQSPR